MTFFIAKTIAADFDQAIERTRAALAAEGFGILTDIDVTATLKAKIGEDFRPYRILGACNPKLAHRALLAEDHVGVMLPCSVAVQQRGPGSCEIAMIDPNAAIGSIGVAAMQPLAAEVAEKLNRALAAI